MKSFIATTFILLTSAPVLATDSLFCNGDAYSLQMSVGSDNIVDSATVRDRGAKIETIYRLSEIENRQLVWTAIEGDVSVNRLEIVLKGKDGQSLIVEAQGRKGILRRKSTLYSLDCDWVK